MSTKNKSCKKKESKLTKCLKAPLRMLCLAKNFYVKALTECSDHAAGYGAAFGCPTGQAMIYTLPRSFSASSSTSTSKQDKDYRELVIRAASTRSPIAKNNVGDFHKAAGGGGGGGKGSYYKGATLPRVRSVSVGIGRIDEDKPCDFQDENSKANKGIDLLPRSKSSAPFKRGTNSPLF